ncbi:MAG TPA: hypothetical protein VGM15_10530 [Burkholderiaceae bacterium]
MHVKGILFLCSLAVVPQLAMAAQPSPQMLGIAQAVADFCSKVDPRDAAAFQGIWKNMASMPAAQLASVEADSTFKQAYQQANAFLAQFSSEEAQAGCKAIVGVPERRPTDDDGRKHK